MSDDKEIADIKKLPTEQKVVHKNWSARKTGYEECIKLFKTDDPNDPDFSLFVDLMKNFPNDANEAARDKALEALLLFLENAAIAHKCAEDILPGIFAKCLTGKANTREKAIKIMIQCVAIDQQAPLQEKLIESLSNKQPKIVQTALEVLRIIISDYGGPKVIGFKQVIKEIPNVIDHRDKTVRDEVKQLSAEMYKWNSKLFMKELKELDKLPDKTVDSLEADLEEAKKNSEKPTQKKYRKSEGKIKEEEEKKLKEEEAKKEKLEASNKAKEQAEQNVKLEEEKKKAQKEAEEKAKIEEEQRIKLELENKSKLDAENKIKLEEQAKQEALQREENEKLKSELKVQKEEEEPTIKVEAPAKRDLKTLFSNAGSIQKLKSEVVSKPIESINVNSNKKEIDEALIDCLIKDGRSTSDFHRPGMLKFLQLIMPGYTPPPKSLINKRLEQKKKSNDNDLKAQLENTSDIALSTELFKNSRNSYFLCLRAHFFDKKFLYKTVVLSFKRFIQSEHISVKINSFIKYELNRLDITTKIRSITTDSSDNIIKATSNNQFGTRISCLVDNLDSTILTSLSLDSNNSNKSDEDFKDDSHYFTENEDEEQESEQSDKAQEIDNSSDDESMDTISNINDINIKTLNYIITKVRRIIRLILNSDSLNEFVAKEAKQEKIKAKLVIDLQLRWHSTFIMLEQFIKFNKIIESIPSNKNLMIYNKRFETLKILKMTTNEWILLKSLVEVLQPFSKAVLLITTKDYHPLSLSQVIITSLKRFLSEKTINIHVNSIKEILNGKFFIYFETNVDGKERSLRLMATYLNPLHFRCLNEKERVEAEELLVKEELEMTKKYSILSVAKSVLDSSIRMKKKESFDLFNDFMQEVGSESLDQYTSDNTNLTFKEEMAYYVASLKRNGAFDDFWHTEKLSLPYLFALAKRIAPTPISSVAANTCFSISGYNQRKQFSFLNSKNLIYSMVLKDNF